MLNENLTQNNPVTHLEMGGLAGSATSKSYKDSLFRLDCQMNLFKKSASRCIIIRSSLPG